MQRIIRPWALGLAGFATTALFLYVDMVAAIA